MCVHIAGIVLSTGPMALVALNEFGVHKMFEVKKALPISFRFFSFLFFTLHEYRRGVKDKGFISTF
jgi:hypothetical protein